MNQQQPTSKINSGALCAYIDAGMTLFPCVGYSKTPKDKGFLEKVFDPEFVPTENNYGVLLKNRYLVIDCDPRSYKENEKPLTSLLTTLELPPDIFKQTFMVRTPKKGFHIYFKKPEAMQLVHSLKEYPGLEFKTKFIMACGSFIDKTPKGEPVMAAYVPVYGSPAGIMAAPQALLNKLLRPDVPPLSLATAIQPDNEADLLAFIQHCKIVQPAVEGQGGDLRTFQVACAGRDFGLSPHRTFDIMQEHFNPRCSPTWHPTDLMVKVQNAYEYSTRNPAGVKSVQNTFTKEVKEPEQIKIRYQLDAHGGIKRCMYNLRMFFEYPVIHETNGEKKVLTVPPIGNLLRYDQFSHRIVWGRPAPWYKAMPEWTDDDAVQFKMILAEQMGIDFSVDLIHEVATICASKRVFHPVREYLEGCKWDGIPRLDTWLVRYCGSVENDYTKFVGRKTLIAAVARVFAPGCKFDHVLVMEGIQGMGKSYLWEILCSPWFTDAPLNIQDKSAVEIMQGKWVVELAEMEALSKYESQAIKGFLTRTEDRCRLAYGKKAQSFPRQNIFVGSINPEATGWLKDRTGNRRYWPVAVTKIDLKRLREDKDQLWAEALEHFRRGEKLYAEDKNMWMLMAAEVDSRMQEDPWFSLIEEHLHTHVMDFVADDNIEVTPVELYMRVIGGTAATFRSNEAARMASILKIMGFSKERTSNKLGYVYRKKHFNEEV